VPESSEIAEINYRYLLDAWKKRQAAMPSKGDKQAPSPTPLHSTQQNEVVRIDASSDQPVRSSRTTSVTSSETSQDSSQSNIVTLKPINVGGVKTDSEKVALGIAAKFSASPPEGLQNSKRATWFVRPPSGGQFGPANAAALKQWMQEGRVTGDCYVWCEGWDNWQLAADVFPAIASKVSIDSLVEANSDQVTAARTRTAYLKARKRRTMRNVTWLLIGTAIVIGLIFVLIRLIQNTPS